MEWIIGMSRKPVAPAVNVMYLLAAVNEYSYCSFFFAEQNIHLCRDTVTCTYHIDKT